MSLRISSLSLLVAVAACSPGQEADMSAIKESVPCAFGEAKIANINCPVERSTVDGKTILTIIHPDGGFRRLEMIDGGKSYVAADGFEEIQGGPNGKDIEIILGDAHYVLPGPSNQTAPEGGNAPAR
jgi:hypothetical protein